MSRSNFKEAQNNDFEKLHLHMVKFKTHGQTF